jgi:hypothetical protein
MASKDTGFHPSDPDWTRGRAAAVADAEALARRQISMRREVAMRELARLGQEYDAPETGDAAADLAAVKEHLDTALKLTGFDGEAVE